MLCPSWNTYVRSVNSSSRPLCSGRSNLYVPHATARSSNCCCPYLLWVVKAPALLTVSRLDPVGPVVIPVVQGHVRSINEGDLHGVAYLQAHRFSRRLE